MTSVCYDKVLPTLPHVHDNDDVHVCPSLILQGSCTDNSICATVTPLYNPWQFGGVMRCPLPLYIDERSYIMAKTEDIPLSMIVGRVDPPHGRIFIYLKHEVQR